jgi:L-lactate dehydrogenase complex protein LldG
LADSTKSSCEKSRQSREKILGTLRANRRPFEDTPPRPDSYLPVTRLETDEDLVTRFKTELERLKGQVYVTASEAEAVQAVMSIIGAEKKVLAWGNLPLAGLTDALTAAGVEIVTARARGEMRFSTYADIEPIIVGITGVDAAFATTGTLALVTTDAQGRLPSLLPVTHIALLRRERLLPRLEDWAKEEGRRAMLESHSVVFITGPSRTGDIEMQTILGVHGPKNVHVVIV